MLITRISQLTGKKHTLNLDVTTEQIFRFTHRIENGEYVQNIFSNLTPAEREFILTGITAEEWINTFSDED